MVYIHEINNILLIDSIDFILATAYSKESSSNNVQRWLDAHVYGRSINGHDYFICDHSLFPSKPSKTGPPRKKYIYFTVDFAISLCLLNKSEKSTLLRNYLIEQRFDQQKH